MNMEQAQSATLAGSFPAQTNIQSLRRRAISPLKGRATVQMNGGWKERDEGWRQRKEDEECNESDYVTEGGITRASFRKTASSLPNARNPFWFRRMLGICNQLRAAAEEPLSFYSHGDVTRERKCWGCLSTLSCHLQTLNASCGIARLPLHGNKAGKKQGFVRAADATCEAKHGRRHTRVDCKL